MGMLLQSLSSDIFLRSAPFLVTGIGAKLDSTRLLLVNWFTMNSSILETILMMSGVVERDIIMWNCSQCKSP